MFTQPTRRLALFAICTLTTAVAYAQDVHLWTSAYNGPGQQDDYMLSLVVDPQGRVFTAGSTRGLASNDARIAGYDALGQLLWERVVDLGGYEYADVVCFDNATGALYALGTSTAPSQISHWVIWRFDPQTGATLWQQDYFGPQLSGGRAYSLVTDASGGVVAGGSLGSSTADVASVARFDSTGTLSWEWSVSAAGVTNGYVSWLAASATGDVVVRTREWVGVAFTSMMHRLSVTGSTLWSRVIGTTEGTVAGPAFDASSNLVYSYQGTGIGADVLVKLDPAGTPLWTRDVTVLFGANTTNYFLAVDPLGDVLALGSNAQLARLDASGNTLWVRAVPVAFDAGFASGLALDTNGDAVVRFRCHAPTTLYDFDSVARWDQFGNFLWSQGVRGVEVDTEVQTIGMHLGPLGAVVLGGWSQTSSSPTKDMFIAALRKQSDKTCFGDGSSGPCPCGNTTSIGTLTGCRRAGASSGARLEDQGIASAGSDSLRFVADAPLTGLLVLLQGTPSATALPLQDGLLCAGSPLLRLYTASSTGFFADFPRIGDVHVHARSASLGDPIPAASSRAYQLYFRGGSSFCQLGNGNLTNAVVVTWGS